MVLLVSVGVGAQEPARSCPSCFVSGAKTGIDVESTGGQSSQVNSWFKSLCTLMKFPEQRSGFTRRDQVYLPCLVNSCLSSVLLSI